MGLSDLEAIPVAVLFFIGGVILTAQGIISYIYFNNISDNFFKTISDTKNRWYKVLFNICVGLGGLGLAASIYGVKSIFVLNKFFAQIANFATLVIAIIASGYIWWLLPGKISTQAGEVSSRNVQDIVLASSISVALLGFLLGSIVFEVLGYAIKGIETEDEEGILYILLGEAIIFGVVVLVQSILFAIVYFFGDNDRSNIYWITFSSAGVFSLIVIIAGIIILAL